MEIILQGEQNNEEILESLQRVFALFEERYGIHEFNEIHLSLTLIDDKGDIVELVDNDSDEVYRIFEVYREGHDEDGKKRIPILKLVVDNTK